MKNLLYVLFVLFISAGCGPDNSYVKLSVDKSSLEFTSEGGVRSFTVTSSDGLQVVPGANWIKVTKGAGRDDNQTLVTVTVGKNTSASARQTTITLMDGAEKANVDVSQAAAEFNNEEIILPEGKLAGNLASIFGIGWNLGNQFDAYNDGIAGETAWGNPEATQETFLKIKEAGFRTVRIPVTWLGKFGGAPNYKISEAWLNRVAEVVTYAENAGLMVIINMHHDGSESNFWLDIIDAAKDDAVHQRVLGQVTAMWTQIAEKFKDKGHFLVFEAFNEIHDGGWGWGDNRKDGGKQYKCLNEWNQAFVDAVRSTGGNNADRILGVPAYCTNTDIAIESFVMPEDTAEDRLMLSVHSYDPSEYTLTAKYSEWGHTAAASKKASGNNENDLKALFVKLQGNFISKGIPVYLGEFGCVNRSTEREQAFQQYYLKYYVKLARIYGVPCMLWDNGAKGHGNEKHAFIDHGTGEYCSEEAEAAVKAMIDSYNNDFTLEQIYDGAPK